MIIRKAGNRIVKSIFKFISALFVIIIIELSIFNFKELIELKDNSYKQNIELTLNEAELINWIENGKVNVSQYDPMIVYNNIDLYIKKIEIKTTMNNKVPYIDIFYTNKSITEFNGNMLLKINEANQDINVIEVNQHIQDLRIDLGDNEGVYLSDFIVIINPVRVNIKVARIVIMLLLYYGSIGLFSLQKSPIYELEEVGGAEYRG